ncbi:MAG: hypothetical protein OEU50_09610 [Gammaproteobacteria bacterium]|nr:hypothetical protein [Gammaproteobacteria bacterium]
MKPYNVAPLDWNHLSGPIYKEESDMQCYKYLAAVIAVANILEAFPETRRKLPLSAIADWMAENDIEPEDLAIETASKVRSKIEILIKQNQPYIRKAA